MGVVVDYCVCIEMYLVEELMYFVFGFFFGYYVVEVDWMF